MTMTEFELKLEIPSYRLVPVVAAMKQGQAHLLQPLQAVARHPLGRPAAGGQHVADGADGAGRAVGGVPGVALIGR